VIAPNFPRVKGFAAHHGIIRRAVQGGLIIRKIRVRIYVDFHVDLSGATPLTWHDIWKTNPNNRYIGYTAVAAG
jgi:hypothetical protein